MRDENVRDFAGWRGFNNDPEIRKKKIKRERETGE